MLKKLKEKEFPLLGRKRITYELDHTGTATPSKKVVFDEVVSEAKSKPELTSVRHIFTGFGTQKSKVIVNFYEDEKILKFLETPKGKKEKKIKEEKSKDK